MFFDWSAVLRNGLEVPRWNDDGSENRPDPWRTCQFMLMREGQEFLQWYVPQGARFIYQHRQDLVVVGWERADEGCYLFCWTDRIEIRPNLD